MLLEVPAENLEPELRSYLWAVKREGYPVPLADLWRLLGRVQAVALKRQGATRPVLLGYDYGRIADLICERGSDADYEKLLRTYDALPYDVDLHGDLFPPLWNCKARRDVASLVKTQPPKIAFPASPAPIPDHLASAPPALQEAWRSYEAVILPAKDAFDSSREEEPGWIRAQEAWPAFYKVLGDILSGRPGDNVAALKKFRWGGWCGTHSERLYEQKFEGLFLGLLSEKRYALAAGMLLEIGGTRWIASQDQGEFGWKKDFLEWCGLDWEKIHAGGAAEGMSTVYLKRIEEHGTERSAQYLLDMADIRDPKTYVGSSYVNALAAFIEPGPKGHRASYPGEGRKVPPELQEKLVDILMREVGPGTGEDEAKGAISALSSLRRPETIPALRRALALPYSRGRKEAADALKAMGEEVPSPAEPKPVRFRLLLNGAPLASKKLEFWTKRASGSGLSSSGTTDSSGMLKIPGAFFEGEGPLTSVGFSMRDISSPGDPWFKIDAPPPENPEDVTEVNISAGDLTIRLKPADPKRARPHSEALVRLFYRGQPRGDKSFHFESVTRVPVRLPVAGTLSIPHLMTGKYDIQLSVPGATVWEGSEVVVEKGGATIEAVLAPGADVRFQVVAPGGEDRDRHVKHQLFRIAESGERKPLQKPFLYQGAEQERYRGLPVGEYVLKVYSSDEAQQEMVEPNEKLAPHARHTGIEKPFTIDAPSPPKIDLGTIALELAP